MCDAVMNFQEFGFCGLIKALSLGFGVGLSVH